MADFQAKKEKVCYTESMDRLSQLPDDILIHIMSFLSTEDAYRTSFISKHWRLHWLYAHRDLNFNTSSFIKLHDLYYPAYENLDVPVLRGMFFKWVNKVLRDRHVVEETSVVQFHKLRIQFPLNLDEECHNQIDEWVSYAFARKVQSLELDFVLYSNHTIYVMDRTNWIPRSLFAKTETDLSCLKSLSLSGINVSNKDIDSFLLKCPFLEHLKVCCSFAPLNIKIVGSPSLALKHLEITHCLNLYYIIIHDTCLVSLTLSRAKNLVLKNNPKLVSVCVSHWYISDGATLQMLSSCLPRLQILTLNLRYSHDEVFDQVPLLSELNQLTLVAAPLNGKTFVRLTTMLSLSPNLEKFTLELEVPKFGGKVEYNKASKIPLQHLKVIELRGYCGEEAEDDLLRCVLKHIVAPIKTIIFDPHTFRCDTIEEFGHPLIAEGIINDKRRAELLKKVIPSSVEFIIL